MEPLLIAMTVAAVAELGDKTQLLALVLSRRYRRPMAVAGGLIVAMAIMHSLAAFGGAWLDRLLPENLLAWLVGVGFLSMAVWMALSRGHDTEEVHQHATTRSAFLAALIVFMVVEFGDKSQLSTVGLAIALDTAWQVALGATLGSIIVNLPVIWLGWKLERRIPHRLFHWAAAGLFALIGIWILLYQALANPY